MVRSSPSGDDGTRPDEEIADMAAQRSGAERTSRRGRRAFDPRLLRYARTTRAFLFLSVGLGGVK